jgi:nicotinate phosphoribosyltransferase
MAYGYFCSGMAEHEAVFHLSFRRNPFQGGYTVCAGLASVIEQVKNFRFEKSDIDYLKTLKTDNHKPIFNAAFLRYLQNIVLTVDIDAIPEGTVVFPHEPLLRVKGPLIQCQLLETLLLNCINFPTLVATKASRICAAAQGEAVIEFGLRRAQGFDAGLLASRAAYIGGCVGTSNVLAGKQYDIPVMGTHAHSWVMTFDNELNAFEQFANALPENGYFLVDTYHTLNGIKNAIKLNKKFRKLKGIRLDSGDLAYLSIQARKMLDKAGLKNVSIMASNNLDEHIIASLKQQKAKINVWGVGTKLATAFDQPALDGVYKLGAIRAPNGEWQYKLKLSEQNTKISLPGFLRARRYYNSRNIAVGDCIYDEHRGITSHKFLTITDMSDPLHTKKIPMTYKYQELLQPIFKQGKCSYKTPPLQKIRQTVFDQLKQFHPSIKRFLNPHIYPVGLEPALLELRFKLIYAMKQSI